MMKAKEHCCEEASFIIPTLPCNEPATRWIGWRSRKEGPYRMCDMCAHHSIQNRNADDLGPYDQNNPTVAFP